MKINIIKILGVIVLFNSCNDLHHLKEENIFSSKKRIIQKFYLNSKNQKDSIELLFRENGKLSKKIFWDNGLIVNFNYKGKYLSSEISKNGLLYGYDINGILISKSSIDVNGNYLGTKIIYNDSIISGIKNFKRGSKEGIFISFNVSERPISIHYIKKDYPIFSLSFFENGSVKSIRSYNREGSLGINFKYHKNRILKSKSELFSGKTDGFFYEYDDKGNLLSKRFFIKGKLLR